MCRLVLALILAGSRKDMHQNLMADQFDSRLIDKENYVSVNEFRLIDKENYISNEFSVMSIVKCIFFLFNPFIPNRISHSYKLDETISNNFIQTVKVQVHSLSAQCKILIRCQILHHLI